MTLLITGLVLVLAFVLGKVATKLGLPKIVGYIIAGSVLSPSLFDFVPKDFVESTESIVSICLTFITFEVGMSLSIEKIRRIGMRLVTLTLFEGIGAFIVVMLGFWFLIPFLPVHFQCLIEFTLPVSLLFASLSVPTDPSATLAVMHEYKAKGEVTDSILGCSAFDDILTLIFFTFSLGFSLSSISQKGDSYLSTFGDVGLQVVGAVVVGSVVGFVFNKSTSYYKLKSDSQLIVLLFGFLMLSFGLCSYLKFDELLSTMSMGCVVVNFNTKIKDIKTIIERYTEELIFILFFGFSAMHMDYAHLYEVWYVIVLFVVLRGLGKFLGIRIGSFLTKSPSNIKKYTFTGLIPQGGIVLGLVMMLASHREFDQVSVFMINVIMGATIFHEFIGPVLAKWGLSKAGEIS